MKKISTSILFLLVVSFGFAQEIKYKEYSFSDLFKMIEEEKDSVFQLENAVIIYNKLVDKNFTFFNDVENLSKPTKRIDSIVVDKEIKFNNVHFIGNNQHFVPGMFSNLVFKRKVQFLDSQIFGFYNIDFHKLVTIEYTNNFNELLKQIKSQFNIQYYNQGIEFIHCNFYDGISYTNNSEEETDIQFGITFSHIWLNKNRLKNGFSYQNQFNFWLTSNTFHGFGELYIRPKKGSRLDIDRNIFEKEINVVLSLYESDITRTHISKNNFKGNVFANIKEFGNTDNITWPQFSNKLINQEEFSQYFFVNVGIGLDSIADFKPRDGIDRFGKENTDYYLKTSRIENAEVYYAEKKLRSVFYNFYKQSQNTDFSNAVYTEMKDLETERLAYLNSVNSSFQTFFTWKINQFLKVFSAYGTEPARAVVFSMWVILLFAFIYLLFPNSWDAHGRKRIMNRYAFFFTYMNKKSGIHEVYLDHQKNDMLEFDEFKALVEQQGKTVPKFFTATALPLYKWAISGTKFSASVLKRVDIMKGTWSELPQSKRIWKSILLIGAFTIAVLYDILIKMLNALMLSINTFTTLGFGEIPIKGLPRYLAIIQGFIGWFMLTIFSVSLISQLLN